jgi:hypothetical protein
VEAPHEKREYGLNGESVTVVLYGAAVMLVVLGVAVMTLE